MDIILSGLENIKQAFSTMKFPADYLDILVVAFLVYQCIKFIKQTRANQLLRGIIFVLVLLPIARLLDLSALGYILGNIIQLSFIAILIVFQPELRSALEHIGRTKIAPSKGISKLSEDSDKIIENMINSTCICCEDLSKRKIGGLIVFEGTTRLGDIIDTGIPMHADITSQSIITVFFPNTPLHDGAMIIRDCKIEAAGCLLPLSQNYEISKSLGTRHRAAVGVSEISDALVVVVSEETGKISIAQNGQITIGVSIDQLRQQLSEKFVQVEKKSIKSWFSRKKRGDDSER